jgi:serine/threonine protein phosphatase PrpC
MRYHLAQLNEPGAVRSQDYAGSAEVGEVLVLALADGAGGVGGGARAAQVAVELALESAFVIDPRDGSAWCQLLARIDAELGADPDAGEATLVVAAVWEGGLVGASVGDSGAVLFGDALLDLTEHQHRRPLLGTGMAQPVPFQASAASGTLLLASDGLLHYTQPDAIHRIIRGPDLQQAAHALVQSVRLPSGALWDDTCVLLFRLDND